MRNDNRKKIAFSEKSTTRYDETPSYTVYHRLFPLSNFVFFFFFVLRRNISFWIGTFVVFYLAQTLDLRILTKFVWYFGYNNLLGNVVYFVFPHRSFFLSYVHVIVPSLKPEKNSQYLNRIVRRTKAGQSSVIASSF